jgi:hypothetical protein
MRIFHVADMMKEVQNMIEASDIQPRDQVLLFADRRSDPGSIEVITTGLSFYVERSSVQKRRAGL